MLIRRLIKIILSCAFILCWTSTNAQVKYLILKQKDGSQASFALASQPIVECQNGFLNIVSQSGSISVSLSSVDRYVLSENPSLDIQDLKAERPEIAIKSGVVVLSGMKPSTNVSVYSVDGREIITITASNEGTAVINLSDYSYGYYIIKAGNTSYKIVNK